MSPNDSQFNVMISELLNFVYDNADIDVHTLTGLDTWHTMGGIVASTPAYQDVDEPEIPRFTKVRTSIELGQFSQIAIRHCKMRKVQGLT